MMIRVQMKCSTFEMLQPFCLTKISSRDLGVRRIQGLELVHGTSSGGRRSRQRERGIFWFENGTKITD
jgi:hypothetical protein